MIFPKQYAFKSQPPHMMFLVPSNGRTLSIIARDGVDTGWDHLSVLVVGDKAHPSREEMSTVKTLFWAPDELEDVFQTDNHLWRCCWMVELRTRLLWTLSTVLVGLAILIVFDR